MSKRHMKCYAMPKTWHFKRKGIMFITRPYPRVKLEFGLPLNVIIRNMLGYASNSKEVKHILLNKQVLVNNKNIKEPKFMLGLMDVIAFPEKNKYFRLLINPQGRLFLAEIKKEEANEKLSKVIGKTALKKGKIQLNLDDGTNIILGKNEYSIGDSVLIEFPNKIKDVAKLEKGNLAYLLGGKHIGRITIIESISGKKVLLNREGESFETPRNYIFVVGRDKPLIDIKPE